MSWKKRGQLFAPDNLHPWMKSHAANPFALHRHGSIFRVYCTSRDAQNQSHIVWVDVDLEKVCVLGVAPQPLLAPGQLGTFDDSGVALGWILELQGRLAFYYLGWNLGVTVPWRNSIGLAFLNPEKNILERHSLAPLLDRAAVDPFSISYPCIIKEKRLYRMWYGSNLSWGRDQSEMQHVIKTASSRDGIHWQREGEIAIGLQGDEYALSKPCVIRDRDRWRMWYSYRGPSYRIGYAESVDGTTWQRQDSQVGIAPSPSGWDSQMICYAHVFEHLGTRYMLYNGNGYGATGFGLAIWEDN
jgi:hypothetical protein